jgi:nitroimidazol reductase NimA-like FMN-containing flavoprotein (pyridoxamine 5'-phosphate oxidase superfamily)
MSTEKEREAALAMLAAVPYGRLALTREALPYVAVARHVVADGQIILRTHRGWGVHRAGDGAVVAYAADNTASAQPDAWVAHITGTASAFTPTEAQRELFGGLPVSADGEPFEPVYLRIEPRYASSYRVYRAEP